MREAIEKSAVLIEALPYIQNFRGAEVVVKLGGSVMEHAEALERLLTDIVFMECVGMRVVLVHGGGKAISRGMSASGIVPRFVQGLRVTCERTIEVVGQVLKGQVNPQIVSMLTEHGARAESLHGERVFRVERKHGIDELTGESLDWGFVGEPGEVDVAPVRDMLAQGILPVISPLGLGSDGRLHNMNADTAAAALARAMRVRKLAFVSDVPGLLRDPSDSGTLIGSVSVSGIEALRRDGIVGGGMLPKMQSCIDALKAGVGKVHLVDGRMPHSLLLEIFTTTGVGTEITADEQE